MVRSTVRIRSCYVTPAGEVRGDPDDAAPDAPSPLSRDIVIGSASYVNMSYVLDQTSDLQKDGPFDYRIRAPPADRPSERFSRNHLTEGCMILGGTHPEAGDVSGVVLFHAESVWFAPLGYEAGRRVSSGTVSFRHCGGMLPEGASDPSQTEDVMSQHHSFAYVCEEGLCFSASPGSALPGRYVPSGSSPGAWTDVSGYAGSIRGLLCSVRPERFCRRIRSDQSGTAEWVLVSVPFGNGRVMKREYSGLVPLGFRYIRDMFADLREICKRY